MLMMRRRRGRRYRSVDCPICIDTFREAVMIQMRCCSQLICKDCMKGYCTEKLNEGIFKIACPFTGCDKKLDHGTIVTNLDEEKHKKLFEKLLSESLSDPSAKVCPGCSRIERVSEESLKSMKKSKSWFATANPKITQIKCSECNLTWCFTCHAPWHDGMTCSTYLNGDKAFSQWMYWQNGADINAHFCPKCRIPIQRSSGCPSMVCSYCKVNWCYDCGQSKAWDYTIFGPHYNKTALKGCLAPAYLYYNSIPITYLIRISALLLMGLGVFAIGLTFLVVVIPLLPIVLLGLFTTMPLIVALKREPVIDGVKPYKILNDAFLQCARFCMFSLVVVLMVIMGPLVLLAGITLLPMLGYLTTCMKKI